MRPLARKPVKQVQGKKKKSLDADLDRAERDSSTESEEDLAFVEKMLISDNLGDIERRLLLGIIQAPPEDKKRYDKETPEEAR